MIMLAGFLVISCKKDQTPEAQCDEVISFSIDVQPLLMNSCATSGCHNAASAANTMVFESYESIFEHKDIILRSVRHEAGVTPMPIGPQLSAENIQIIACWIEQGAANN